MSVQGQSFTQILTGFATAVQGAASSLVSFVIGSVLRAIGEGTAWIAMYLQGLILTAIALTRAATSNGVDLDSWLAQFGFTRLPPSAASGQVTFSRFTYTQQAVIPVGSIVQTGDGTQQYQVVADTTNPAYSASLNGFLIPAGTQSVSCTVVGITPGSNSLNLPDASGNVTAGAVNALYQSIPYVDTVSNASAFTNGKNAESDAAARIRFVGWLATLARATPAAVGAAISALGANFAYTIVENQNYNGSLNMGYFYVVVDDGTGYPSSTTLSTAYNAINAVRPITSTFGVFAPVVVNAVVSMTLTTTSTGAGHSSTTAIVQTAVQNYINSLKLGQPLSYLRIAQVAFDASSDVIDVTALLLNGGTSDLVATNQQVIKATSVSVI
ncbi:baseplate J/gp47 family protein [Burkholderia multivorans]|uniref:baseplate J/gp47 family protein n=1 Tax=Burkholderia multivorans TaxID=87883 RepID=UPI001C246707|nr:baseplate J/gp47 family protein [Burkholderia multivorans]MBU9629926.1 baseplate J/gp47 family protein [Burkholderia multivorans]